MKIEKKHPKHNNMTLVYCIDVANPEHDRYNYGADVVFMCGQDTIYERNVSVISLLLFMK